MVGAVAANPGQFPNTATTQLTFDPVYLTIPGTKITASQALMDLHRLFQ
jgi:hypothetical protein